LQRNFKSRLESDNVLAADQILRQFPYSDELKPALSSVDETEGQFYFWKGWDGNPPDPRGDAGMRTNCCRTQLITLIEPT